MERAERKGQKSSFLSLTLEGRKEDEHERAKRSSTIQASVPTSIFIYTSYSTVRAFSTPSIRRYGDLPHAVYWKTTRTRRKLACPSPGILGLEAWLADNYKSEPDMSSEKPR